MRLKYERSPKPASSAMALIFRLALRGGRRQAGRGLAAD